MAGPSPLPVIRPSKPVARQMETSSAQVLLEQYDAGAVNEQVGAELQEVYLLLQVNPEMDTCADACRARLAEDSLACGEEVRMVVALRQAEATGKIVRADEYGVQTGHGQDFVQGFDGGSAE